MAAGREDVRPLARGDAIPRWAAYRQEFGAVSTFLSAGGPTPFTKLSCFHSAVTCQSSLPRLAAALS